ncbi:hypothetical protein Srot_1414 [Segniliparus rotundus DSM 44985]|uniref:Uncharacterized protein n=1 Tax=Segniliparus rotundus (strain ATCC BAA-972 / CDC 1076 / CIP 108378 / DSM 44985 / JCM 13578) TaxID=640132 RepID=D6Z7E8_SEGRD|nr:hypothetical protein [Segniliparus rotundus]ADG97878.1 hypothetical protein Srot_1414 [Segniliparus rotundus DSM 44985]
MVTLAFPDDDPYRGAGWQSVKSGLIRRRDAACRLAPFECGCSDPWRCRCGDDEEVLSEFRLDCLAAAYWHVLERGYTPVANWPVLRRLWRRGGIHRRLALLISKRSEEARER